MSARSARHRSHGVAEGMSRGGRAPTVDCKGRSAGSLVCRLPRCPLGRSPTRAVRVAEHRHRPGDRLPAHRRTAAQRSRRHAMIVLTGAAVEGRPTRANYPGTAFPSIAGGSTGSVAFAVDGGIHNDRCICFSECRYQAPCVRLSGRSACSDGSRVAGVSVAGEGTRRQRRMR
jgi:hypothetical protein